MAPSSSKFESIDDILDSAEEGGVGCWGRIDRSVRPQFLCHHLLNEQRESFVVITEEVHAWEMMPRLVQHFIRNQPRRAVPKSGNRLFLALGVNIVVEDRLRFLMSGAVAILK